MDDKALAERLDKIDQRLQALEQIAHPQHVMADPALRMMLEEILRTVQDKKPGPPRVRWPCEGRSVRIC